ncbi:MAG: sporulation protein [Deltaproteobacteria bacterium]|nr:sporulation protein [Deltaproteobacteria bacterium]
MGLFDAFGVGGGNLSLQLLQPMAQSGGLLQGQVVFASGRRAQNITAIKIRFTTTVTVPTKTPQGVQNQSKSETVLPDTVLCGAFTSQPGQQHPFPFQLQLPTELPSSTPGAVQYHLYASADIDGEVDPGANAEVKIQGIPFDPMRYGGAAAAMAPMGMPMKQDPYAKGYDKGGYDGGSYDKGGYVDPGAKGGYDKGGYVDPGAKGGYSDPYDKGGYDKGGYADPGAKGGYVDPGAKGGYSDPYGKGAKGGGMYAGQHVQAQWTDGQYYGATITQENNGMYCVQWDDGSPAQWVRGDQVMPG